jgi:hypothetical protein
VAVADQPDRLGCLTPPHTKAHLEGHILRHFLRYARPYLSGSTRRVGAADDGAALRCPYTASGWTYSPLIATHFATAGLRKGVAAAIWQLDWRQLHQAFKLPQLALLVSDLQQLFDDHRLFTPWQLFEWEENESAFACLIEPPAFDRRLVAQAAAFTLSSDTRHSFDSFLKQQGLSGALTKYVLPAAEIGRVRDQLDLVGIDERRLFPDLGGLASELRRYYG